MARGGAEARKFLDRNRGRSQGRIESRRRTEESEMNRTRRVSKTYAANRHAGRRGGVHSGPHPSALALVGWVGVEMVPAADAASEPDSPGALMSRKIGALDAERAGRDRPGTCHEVPHAAISSEDRPKTCHQVPPGAISPRRPAENLPPGATRCHFASNTGQETCHSAPIRRANRPTTRHQPRPGVGSVLSGLP